LRPDRGNINAGGDGSRLKAGTTLVLTEPLTPCR
jgi:hypothetical protein